MKTFEEFTINRGNESGTEVESLDEGSKRGEKSVAIWTTRANEETLRAEGYTIPKFPKQGDVLDSKGKKIGYISNFGGLSTTDKTLEKIANANNMTVWNVM